MAITSAAKKEIRGSEKKRIYNMRRRRVMNETVKKIHKLIKDKKAKEARELIPQAQKVIDKALKRGIIKKNTAARKKSRLVALIKKSK